MAATARNCLGIDIGSDTVRIAHMEMTRQGPRVQALLEQRIETEPGATEAKRYQALAKQIQEMLKRAKIRTKNAIFCVPGQSVFVRRIPLPKANPDQMRRMVKFEARQQIPFPLDKTIMEYQVFEEPGEKDVQVLLVAIKRDYINNFMQLVRRSGLKALAISVSSIALYNFHEFNTSSRDFADKPKAEDKKRKDKTAADRGRPGDRAGKKGFSLSLFRKKSDAAVAEVEEELGEGLEEDAEAPPYEEIQAYVNLGATLTDLAIAKPGASRMVGFTRSVPLAGNEMDRAIRERLRLDSLEAARQLKETKVAILSSEFETAEESEPIDVGASEAATAVADRLISELRRSLDFFISQPDGVAVDSLVLSGGLARTRHLAEYIEERVGLPVSLAEAAHPQMRMPDDPPEHFSGHAIAVGLALQGLGLAQNLIDFLPEEIKTVRGLQEHKIEVGGMIAMALVMIMLSVNIGNAQIAALRNETIQLEARIQRFDEIHQQVTASIQRYNDVQSAFAQLSLVATHQFWLFNIMTIVVERRPPEVLVDNLALRTDGIVVIDGWARDLHSIRRFVGELQNYEYSPGFRPLYDVQIHEMSQPTTEDHRFNIPMHRYTIWFKTFGLKGRLRMIGDRAGIMETDPRAGRAGRFPRRR